MGVELRCSFKFSSNMRNYITFGKLLQQLSFIFLDGAGLLRCACGNALGQARDTAGLHSLPAFLLPSPFSFLPPLFSAPSFFLPCFPPFPLFPTLFRVKQGVWENHSCDLISEVKKNLWRLDVAHKQSTFIKRISGNEKLKL